MKHFILLLFLSLSLFGATGIDALVPEYVTFKEDIKNNQEIKSLYLTNLNSALMHIVKQEHRKETFSLAKKMNDESQKKFDELLVTAITDSTLLEIKLRWKLPTSIDRKLFKKAKFEYLNNPLFSSITKKSEHFFVADFFGMPVYAIATTHAKEFPVLSKILTVLTNRHTFLDTAFMNVLVFIYVIVDQFFLVISMVLLLWLIPLAITLNYTHEKGTLIVLNKLFVYSLIAVFSFAILYFLLFSLADVLKVLLYIVIMVALAPLLILIIFGGLGYAANNFIFMGEASFSQIMVELIRYKLIYELKINIPIDRELIWFVLKIFILLLTSNRIYFVFMFLASYVIQNRFVRNMIALGGLGSLMAFIYSINVEKFNVVFELFSKLFEGVSL